MPNRYNWMADTTPEASAKLMELASTLSEGEKLRQALRLSGFMIRMQEAAIRKEYPDAPEREIHLRAAARRYGLDLIRAAHGWDPGDDA